MRPEAQPIDPAPRRRGVGPAPLAAWRKAVFGLGDHTVNLALSSLSLVFFTFLVTVAGLEPWRAGVLAWIARLVDAVSDPLMGRLSDNTRWRAGRRRPYFLIGMLPLGICFALIWQTPFDGQAAMFAYYLCLYVGLCLSMTVVSVPYMALIPEIASDYDERTSINTFRAAAAVLGTMVAALFFSLAQGMGGGRAGFAAAGGLLAVWLVAPWPFVFAVSSETGPVDGARRSSLRAGMRSLARHGSYVRLCAAYIMGRVAMDLLGLAVPLFLSLWIGRPEDVSLTLVSMLLVVVLSLPAWLHFARHREKSEIYVAGCLWFIACLGLIWLSDPGWPRAAVFAAAAVMGVGYAVVDLMPWAMLGEVIDEDELLTGERREGIYNGLFTFIRKLGGATAYMLAGFALSLAGYDKELARQPDSALTTIRIVTTLVPAACLGLSLLAALGYPLGRARHAAILSELGRRHAAAEPEQSR